MSPDFEDCEHIYDVTARRFQVLPLAPDDHQATPCWSEFGISPAAKGSRGGVNVVVTAGHVPIRPALTALIERNRNDGFGRHFESKPVRSRAMAAFP